MVSELPALETNINDAELFQIPDTKTVLWDHSAAGASSKIQFAVRQRPRVNIKEKALQEAAHFLESVQAGIVTCIFTGSLKRSEGSSSSEIVLNLKKFEEHVEYLGIDDVPVPVLIFKKTKGDIKRETITYLKDLQDLFINCRNQACMNGRDFFKWYATCSIIGGQCDLKIEMVSLASSFTIVPLHTLPVIASELSEFLSKANGDTVYTGVVTIDCNKTFILIPEDFETLPSLPLVGIWISGIDSVHHPIVWAACVRYISSSFYQRRLCLPPQPFLLITYEPDEEFPRFYDCIYKNSKIFPEYVLYEGVASTSLPKVKIYDSRSLSISLEEMKERPVEFEAAVEQILPHEITPLYFNIVTNIEDNAPKPPVQMQFEEAKMEKLVEMNQHFVSEVSMLEDTNFRPTIISENRLPAEYRANDFHRMGYNSSSPIQASYESGNKVHAHNAGAYPERQTLSSPSQFIDGYQENMVQTAMHEQRHAFNYPKPSYQPYDMANQTTIVSSNKNTFTEQNTDFSPVIVNHIQGMRPYFPNEPKHPVCDNTSALPAFYHGITPVQQSFNSYPDTRSQSAHDYNKYQMRFQPPTHHVQDQQHSFPLTDNINFKDQQWASTLAYNQGYSQDRQRGGTLPNKAINSALQNTHSAFPVGMMSSRGGTLPNKAINSALQNTHSAFPVGMMSSSKTRLVHRGSLGNEQYNLEMQNYMDRPPKVHSIQRNSMGNDQLYPETKNLVGEMSLRIPDSQQNVNSNPVSQDIGHPIISKSTVPYAENPSVPVSTVSAIFPDKPISVSTSSCTIGSGLNTSNKSTAQDMSSNLPKKSCLKKTQSPNVLPNPSKQTSSSIKKNLPSMKEPIASSSKKDTSHSKVLTNIRTSSKVQKQETQRTVKAASKKNEIVVKPNNKPQITHNSSQRSKISQISKPNMQASSRQQNCMTAIKDNVVAECESVIKDNVVAEYESVIKDNAVTRSAAVDAVNEMGLEVTCLQPEQATVENKIGSVQSNASAVSTLEIDVSKSVNLANSVLQLIQKQDERITESINEQNKKIDCFTNSVLHILHQSLNMTVTSPVDKTPSIKDKDTDKELRDQINTENVQCHCETKKSNIAPKLTKSSTPNTSDPKSLPQISMSAVNGSIENSPNLRSNDFVYTQTVTYIKQTCTASTMTSFVGYEPNRGTPTKVIHCPVPEQDQNMPPNESKQHAKSCKLSNPMTCENLPPVLKDKNMLRVRHHLSDSEITKIKQRMNYEQSSPSHQAVFHSLNSKSNQQYDHPRMSSKQHKVDDNDFLPMKLVKNKNNEFVQDGIDTNIKQCFCNTMGIMENMLRRVNRLSLPNTPSQALETHPKKRLSNPGKHEGHPRRSKSKNKSNTRLFEDDLLKSSRSPRMPSPCDNEDSEIKLVREIDMLKNALKISKKGSNSTADRSLSVYGLSPSKMSSATKQYMDKFGLHMNKEYQYEEYNDEYSEVT